MEEENSKIRPPKATDIRAADLQASAPSETALPSARLKLARTLRVINEMTSNGVIGRYAIGGAIGATFYLEPLTTMDVDVFVAIYPEAGGLITPRPIYEYLDKRGYKPVGEAIKIEDWLVQFLPPTGPLVEEAIAQAREVPVADDLQTFVLTAEHLVAIALQTGRPKDMARILQFVEAGKFDADRLQQILERHGLVSRWTDFKQRFLQDK